MDMRVDGAATVVRCPVSHPEDLVDLVLLVEALGRPVWGFTCTVRELGTRGLLGTGRPAHRHGGGT